LPKLVGNGKGLLHLSFIQARQACMWKDIQPSMAPLFTTETSSSHYESLAGFGWV